MTVKDIVIFYLVKNGFDGLCCEDCGCELDDLMPCAGNDNWNSMDNCKPGYKVYCDGNCEECERNEYCDKDYEFCDWYITERKPNGAV